MKTKNTIAVFFCMLTVSICIAQMPGGDKVPVAVKEKFSAMYPAATNVSWENENDLFEAEFKVSEKELCVVFDASGKYIQTETEIEIASLPTAIKEYAGGRQGKPIDEASQIRDASGTVTYEAEIDGVDYLFDSEGKLLGMENYGEEDDDDDEEGDD